MRFTREDKPRSMVISQDVKDQLKTESCMTFIEVKSLRRSESDHKKKAMSPTFSKEQQQHKPCSMLNQTQIKMN